VIVNLFLSRLQHSMPRANVNNGSIRGITLKILSKVYISEKAFIIGLAIGWPTESISLGRNDISQSSGHKGRYQGWRRGERAGGEGRRGARRARVSNAQVS